MGEGLTVEHQVTGKEEFGGIQMLMYKSKNQKLKKKPAPRPQPQPQPVIPPYPIFPPQPHPHPPHPVVPMCVNSVSVCESAPMNDPMNTNFSSFGYSGGSGGGGGFGGGGGEHFGSFRGVQPKEESRICCDDIDTLSFESKDSKEIGLGAGGTMKQKVIEDPYGIESWDQTKFSRVFIHIVNPAMYEEITGEKCPKNEITAKVYGQHGYPWFDLYEDGEKGIGGSKKLENVKTIKEIKNDKNMWPKEDNETVNISNVVTIGEKKKDPNNVRDGNW